MKNKELKVEPIRKYTTPKYPSYSDKNPIDYPETLPYPFYTKVLHGLLITGLVVAPSGFSINPTVENPFAFHKTGLPHVPAMFGTGLPLHLSSKEARSTIFKVFKEAGITLQEDYVIEKNGYVYKLDGYNPNKKIGFAWLHYDNLEEDNYNRTWQLSNNIDRIPSNLEKLVSVSRILKEDYLRSRANVEDEISAKLSHYNDRIIEITHIGDATIQDASIKAFKHEYLTYLLSINKLKRDFKMQKEAKAAFSLPKEEQQAAFEKIFYKYEMTYFTSIVNHHFASKYSRYVLEKMDEWKTVRKIRHLNNMTHLAELGRQMKESTDKEKINNAIRTFGINWSLTDLEAVIEEERREYTQDFSLEEVQSLDELVTTDKMFIAPISSYNPRFQYHNFGSGIQELPLDIQKHIKEEAEKIEDYEKKRLYIRNEVRKEMAKRKIETPYTKTLAELEKQVRQYIAWAKSQGMY